MPELPEVEIVRQSLSKNLKGKKINKVLVRNRNLRFKLKPYFENLLILEINLFFNLFSKECFNLNLKFLFLTKTLLIFLPFIFFDSDCRTISTSGNSGI